MALKGINEWLNELTEMRHIPSVDGKPLEPHSLYGAKSQIQALAFHIRTTFALDDQYRNVKNDIIRATQMLDRVAEALSNLEVDDELRYAPHAYANPGQRSMDASDQMPQANAGAFSQAV